MKRTGWPLIAVVAVIALFDGDAVHTRLDSVSFEISAPDHVSHADELGSALVPLAASRASDVAVRNGKWTDTGTWSSGVPAAGARVLISPDVTVTVDAPIAVAALEWVRIEGHLHFSPAEHCQMSATTILVTSTGTLSIGTPDHPVDAGNMVQLVFAPRSANARQLDHLDMLGGLLVFGHLSFYGAPKTAFATPSTALHRGVSGLQFSTLPAGWHAGDELLFPAVDPAAEDERRHILSIASGSGRSVVVLSSPLRFSHVPPAGVPAEVPVGNLTRSITVTSSQTGSLYQRGHVMVMTHEAAHISGTSFLSLGRTSAAAPHTLPTRSAGGGLSAGANPIGRYAVHFHLATGASRKVPPHLFTDNVIVDSPKFGLVNHGAYVVAEDNVTYSIQGTHFFAENGSEIGAFRHNLAVASAGSGEAIEGRQAGIADFGHGGHGFWSESPALMIEGNYAFHHAGPAYVVFAAPIEAAEGTQNVFFRGGALIANVLRENLEVPLQDVLTAKQIPSTMIPFRFSHNAAANSERGLEIWHTNVIADHQVPSVVEDSIFWNVRSAGIVITYGVNTVIRDSIILGSDPIGCAEDQCVGSIGITSEGRTRNLTIDQVRVARFSTGVRVPARGMTTISRSDFGNRYNMLLYAAQQPGRSTRLLENTFASHQGNGEDYHLLQGRPLFHGDLSMLLERDVLIVTDQRFPGRTIYRPGQHPAAVPFRDTGIPELDGKTSVQIKREYGLAIAGALAPDDAVGVPGIGGLVGSLASRKAEMADEEQMLIRVDDLQTGARTASYSSNYEEGYGADCCNIHRIVKGRKGDRTGWHFFTEHHDDTNVTRLTYVDASPPRFELDSRIRLQIHPDDVKFGFLIQGTLYDDGAGPEIVRATYGQLTVDREGYVTVPFEYADRAGNVIHHDYRLEVTRRAVQRGPDLSCCREEATLLETMRAIVRKQSARFFSSMHRYLQVDPANRLVADELGLVRK